MVADVAEESMKAAVERVKESPHHATMRNCGGNPVHLRAMIMNISKHFQVCIYIMGGCACVYVCVCGVNVCDCVSFMCISAFHT